MWWKITLGIVAGLAIVVTSLLFYGAWRWQDATEALHARLDAGRVPVSPQTYDPGELAGLPPPVQNYFETVLTPGQALVTAVYVDHTGTFNLSEAGEQWVPFTSSQRVVTHRPGFVWNARMPMMPGMIARIHDAYVDGDGILHAALFGLVTVMEATGTPDLAQGELLRYFAEAAWYPTALLPSQGVTWEAVDANSARASLRDGDVTATLLFHFDENGLVDWVRADARGRAVTKDGVNTVEYAPWEGHWSNFAVYDGMLVPTDGEVVWLLPEGDRPYWRGHIAALHYEFAE